MELSIKPKETNIGITSLRDGLKQFIEDTGMTKAKVAQLLGLANSRVVTSIIDGKQDITLNVAYGISRLLNLSDEGFLQSSLIGIKEESQLDNDSIARCAFLYSHFDCQELKNMGFFQKDASDESMCDRITSFFGYRSIYEFQQDENVVNTLFSKSKMSANERRSNLMQHFWIATAKASLEAMNNPYDYDREMLLEFIKRIPSYSTDVDQGMATVISVLYRLGVTVLVQDYITRTRSFGVSLFVNDKPCIVLTGLKQMYHKLWLTLMHELYHILQDAEYLKKVGYHISDMDRQDVFVSEENADRFAYHCFINEPYNSQLETIVISDYKVYDLAKRLQIHPSMVYGIYLEQLPDSPFKNNEFKNHTYLKHLLQLKDCRIMQNIVYNPIAVENIKEAVHSLKERLGILTA